MGKIASFILSLAFVLSSASAMGQNEVPRVLIIGDSIAGMYTSQTAQALKGKAKVEAAYRPTHLVLNSTTILEQLDQLLGRVDRNGKPVGEDRWPKWDLIHVNVGLGDLLHRAPNMKSLRLLPIPSGGVIVTEPMQYEKNLEQLIRQLKAKALGAKIVWASTTPIRFSRNKVFKMGTEIEYNKIADRVMKKNGVPINDMYSYTKSLMNMDKPAGHGADPFHFDKKPIHGQVVQVIARELRIPLEKKNDLAKAD